MAFTVLSPALSLVEGRGLHRRIMRCKTQRAERSGQYERKATADGIGRS